MITAQIDRDRTGAREVLVQVAAQRAADDQAEARGRERITSERAAFYASRGGGRPWRSRRTTASGSVTAVARLGSGWPVLVLAVEDGATSLALTRATIAQSRGR